LVANLIPANTNSPKSFDYIAGELKASFSGVKTEQKAAVKKVEQEKVSGEKKAPVAKKPRAKKEEVVAVEAPAAE
jgi:tRNA A37 threonylcarbamoyltransferase TsaD